MDLVAFVQHRDRCWIERRYEDLADFIDKTADYASPPGMGPRFKGPGKIMETHRKWLSDMTVRRFHAENYEVTRSRGAAVVEYDYRIEWEREGQLEWVAHEIVALCERRGLTTYLADHRLSELTPSRLSAAAASPALAVESQQVVHRLSEPTDRWHGL